MAIRRTLAPVDPRYRPTARDIGRNIAIDVQLDLRPLARALRDLPKEALSHSVHRALNRGIDKFKSEAHKLLKDFTKVRRPTRLKRGVRLFYAAPGRLRAHYVIRDRNIVVTKAMFGAKSSTSPRGAALVRWGRGARAPTSWTSWDGARTRFAVFMMRGKSPVFIRLRKRSASKSFGAPVDAVSGPNPAEIVRLKAPYFGIALRYAAQSELERQIAASYKYGVAVVKRRYGL